eukprot:TRINITY_DN5182_c0_g1_i7.p1 TRINITY_DN5182_c0_g1~~TRINITY_DN5182_c0_g1_i7.p1  ORF type:complete len:303 (+),score=33.12 TRINITY_DN5182_c0_g1_i7:244-1152(+)
MIYNRNNLLLKQEKVLWFLPLFASKCEKYHKKGTFHSFSVILFFNLRLLMGNLVNKERRSHAKSLKEKSSNEIDEDVNEMNALLEKLCSKLEFETIIILNDNDLKEDKQTFVQVMVKGIKFVIVMRRFGVEITNRIDSMTFYRLYDAAQTYYESAKTYRDSLKSKEATSTPTPSESEECQICLDGKVEILLPCVHGFCNKCASGWYVEKGNYTCPICRSGEIDDAAKFQKETFAVIGKEDVASADSDLLNILKAEFTRIFNEGDQRFPPTFSWRQKFEWKAKRIMRDSTSPIRIPSKIHDRI